MRDISRIYRLCSLLIQCWLLYPDQRFFQLLSNIYKSDKKDSFYVEDDETETMLTEFLNKNKKAGK